MLGFLFQIGEFAFGTTLLVFTFGLRMIKYILSFFLNEKKDGFSSKKKIIIGCILIIIVLFLASEKGIVYIGSVVSEAAKALWLPIKKALVYFCYDVFPILGMIVDKVGVIWFNFTAFCMTVYNFFMKPFGFLKKAGSKVGRALDRVPKKDEAVMGTMTRKQLDKHFIEMNGKPFYPVGEGKKEQEEYWDEYLKASRKRSRLLKKWGVGD